MEDIITILEGNNPITELIQYFQKFHVLMTAKLMPENRPDFMKNKSDIMSFLMELFNFLQENHSNYSEEEWTKIENVIYGFLVMSEISPTSISCRSIKVGNDSCGSAILILQMKLYLTLCYTKKKKIQNLIDIFNNITLSLLNPV